jgi:hypothetical protein
MISKELLQEIVNYLQTKPFNEVAGLLMKIQQEVNKVDNKEVKDGNPEV